MVNSKIYNFFVLSIYLLPILISYNLVFYMGMDYAVDRSNYLYLMSNPSFEMREEPLLILISKVLWFISNPKLKLLFVQNFFNGLVFLSIYRALRLSNCRVPLSALFFLAYLLFFALIVNIQLRIGYALSIFLFLYFFLKINLSLKNIFIYLIPIFCHMGVLLLFLFLYFFKYLKINSLNKVLVFNLLTFSGFFLVFGGFGFLISFFGFDPYYMGYMDSESFLNESLKVIPNAVLLYFLSTFILLYKKNKINKDYAFWFSFSSYSIVFFAYIFNNPILFKFLIPIVGFIYIFLLNKISNFYRIFNLKVFFVFSYAVVLLFSILLFLLFFNQSEIMEGIV